MKTSDFLTYYQDLLHAYEKICTPILKQFDLGQVSFDILMFVENNPEFCTAQQISQVRNIKKNLVSVHVERLVNAGLLQRGIVDGDRRKIALSTTKKARPIIEAGLAMQQEYYKGLVGAISEERLEAYLEIVQEIAANAKRMADDRDPRSTRT